MTLGLSIEYKHRPLSHPPLPSPQSDVHLQSHSPHCTGHHFRTSSTFLRQRSASQPRRHHPSSRVVLHLPFPSHRNLHAHPPPRSFHLTCWRRSPRWTPRTYRATCISWILPLHAEL